MCCDKFAFVGLGRTATHLLLPCAIIFFAFQPTYEWLVYFQRSCAESVGHFEDFLHTRHLSLSLLLSLLFGVIPSGFLHIRSIIFYIVFIGLRSIWVSDTTF